MNQNKKNIPEYLLFKIQNPPAGIRADGFETRNRIIECAGKLFARYGYDKTTSKSICNMARVNLAAVNYHFGSRDGLYITILEEIQNRIARLDTLTEIQTSSLPPLKKIEAFLDFYIQFAFKKDSWPIQLWSRELLNPSPYLQAIITKKSLPKFFVICKIFNEYLGYPTDDNRLYAAILTVMAPFAMACLGQRHPLTEQSPVKISKKELVRQLRANAILTIQALRNAAGSG